MTFLFSGDFRQTLPVIPKGTRADEVQASLKSSYVWKDMRVQLQGNIDEGTEFAKMLLEIGEGRTQEINGTNEIKIEENLERETPAQLRRAPSCSS